MELCTLLDPTIKTGAFCSSGISFGFAQDRLRAQTRENDKFRSVSGRPRGASGAHRRKHQLRIIEDQESGIVVIAHEQVACAQRYAERKVK